MTRSSAAPPGSRTMACLLLPQSEALDVVGPVDVFLTAGRLSKLRPPPYGVLMLGRQAGPVPLAGGISLVADRPYRDAPRGIDTLLVVGNLDLEGQSDPELLDWLRSMALSVRRLVSICTGAFFLAEAGLLDGRRATTHWESCPRLARRYPRVTVEPDNLYVRHGSIYSSAGISAGIDLALHLVEEDLGRAVALRVAREMVLFLKRPGGQSQFSAALLAQEVDDDRLGALTSWILEHLEEELPVPRLAERAHVSPRQLNRLFRRETGLSPAAYVERARLEVARRELTDTGAPIQEIARRSGFGNPERMRRAFQRNLRLAPSEYRDLHGS